MLISDSQHDQAAGLRRLSASRPVRVIAVTSGKGGVGKTNVSVNLAVSLANLGKDVVLMDADLGLANVDVMLGLNPQYNLQHVLLGECSLDEVMVEGPAGIKIVPASSGTKHMAELSPTEHAGVIRAFSETTQKVDVMIVDTAAGISDSVISFSRASQEVIVVVKDEPTSITDAYALIKLLSRDYGLHRFHILANMVDSEVSGRNLFAKLTKVTDRFLDVLLDYMGAVPYDPAVSKAAQRQKAVVECFPQGGAAKAYRAMAKTTLGWPEPRGGGGHLEFFVERLLGFGGPAQEVEL